MGFLTSPALDATGIVVLDDRETPIDPAEWLGLDYVGWRSSGITRFAALASAAGEIECNGFWNHTPPRTDKDGVWIDSQVAKAPTLQRLALEPGANVGRCRVIELQPNTCADAIYNLHQDDNNRLVDTQRFWHAVWHRGTAPRYSQITSWTAGAELDAYIAANHSDPHPTSVALPAISSPRRSPRCIDASRSIGSCSRRRASSWSRSSRSATEVCELLAVLPREVVNAL